MCSGGSGGSRAARRGLGAGAARVGVGRSVGALPPAEDHRDRPRQDRQVEPDRPRLDVEEVEPHQLVEREVAAPADLPQAGDARAAPGSASGAGRRGSS